MNLASQVLVYKATFHKMDRVTVDHPNEAGSPQPHVLLTEMKGVECGECNGELPSKGG